MKTIVTFTGALAALMMIAPTISAQTPSCEQLTGAARGACEAELAKAKAAAKGRSEEMRGLGAKAKGQGAERGKGMAEDAPKGKPDAAKGIVDGAKERAKK